MTVRRAPIAKLASGEHTLDAPTSHYLTRVLRLQAGDAFIAFDPRASREADAQIMRIAPGAVVASVGVLREAKLGRRNVTLVQGLAKGEKCDAIVRDATELGVTEIIFVSTERSVVRLGDARASERLKRWSKIAEQAARQSGRASAPTVALSSWLGVMEAEAGNSSRLVLDPHAAAPLAPRLLELAEGARALSFAVGAEGGFSEKELEIAEKQGWKCGHFGGTVLRAETTAAAFLGALRAFEDLLADARI